MTRRRLCAALAMGALAGCGRRKKVAVPAAGPRVIVGMTEEGLASWYGHPYHGRRTTSGEIYDMELLTAAHRTLPLGTRVRVENLSNGHDVEVRINDRGPFVEDRIIDLSRAAARKIQMLGPGTARVRLRVVGLPGKAEGGFFAVQVGAFLHEGNAERLRRGLAKEYGAASVQKYNSPRGLFYRVLVGREGDLVSAQSLAGRLKEKGHRGFVVHVDDLLPGDRI